MTSIGHIWGTHAHERNMSFPCDRFLRFFDEAYYRGITIRSNPEVIYKWLCQMRIAPYSYDWIDNLGRISPSYLIPGIDRLEIGHEMMHIFEVIDFSHDEYLTLCTMENAFPVKVFGTVMMCYFIKPIKNNLCRLLVKFLIRYPNGILGMMQRIFLPWGDLIMMRRQLMNFKMLSEKNQAKTNGSLISAIKN